MGFPILCASTWRRAAVCAVVTSLLATAALAGPALALFQDEASPQSLSGVFAVAITPDDVPSNLVGGPALTGFWNLTFNGDGTFTLGRQDVGEVVRGLFESGAATVTFTEWSGLVGCEIPAGGEPVTYAWQEGDDALVLTPITDSCSERLTLFTSRSLGRFEACTVQPRSLTTTLPPDIALDEFFATPVAPAATGVAAQEGLSEGEDVEQAIDSLLRQANGCWATGDPARFLALHSNLVVDEILFLGPVEDFARQLRLFMSTPLAFERIGDVNLIDPEHAWAYVEVTLGGDSLPQRLDFVFEDGAWRFDTFFLFGPPEAEEQVVTP
jgi:hypothetical protein